MLSWILRVSRVLRRNVARKDGRMGGDQQDIVEGQRFLNDAHSKTPGRKAALYAPVRGRQTDRC